MQRGVSSMRSLAECVTYVGELCQKRILETDANDEGITLDATLFIWLPQDESGEPVPVLVGPLMARKDFAAMAMRKLMRELGVTHYVFASEAWSRSIDPKDADETGMPNDGLMPREAPDRLEVLLLTGSDLRGQSVTQVFEMARDGLGRVREFRRLCVDYNQMAGRFTDMLGEITVQ